MAELAFEDPERMLYLGAHLRDDPVDLLVWLIQLTALRGLAHPTPEGAALLREGGLPTGMDIALVRPDGCFLALQKLVPDLAVMGRGLVLRRGRGSDDGRIN